MFHTSNFIGIFVFLWNWSTEPTQANAPLSFWSNFPSALNRREQYMIFWHRRCPHTYTQTKCLKYLRIGSKRPFPHLEISHAPSLSCVLPFLQCFLRLTCKDVAAYCWPAGLRRACLGPQCRLWAFGRYQGILGDAGWVLGGDGRQSVLAPSAGWTPRSAVQAACQGSCYCQAFWVSTDFSIPLFIYLFIYLLWHLWVCASW